MMIVFIQLGDFVMFFFCFSDFVVSLNCNVPWPDGQCLEYDDGEDEEEDDSEDGDDDDHDDDDDDGDDADDDDEEDLR